MGIIKQGILGGFSGKVGSVVGTSWKGIAVMRSLAQNVANPNTEAQQRQRGAMANVVTFSRGIMEAVIKPVWNPYASGMSGYNLFVKTNIKAFSKEGTVDTNLLELTRGNLTPESEVTGSQNANGTVTVSLNTNPAYEGAAGSQRVYILALDKSNGEAELHTADLAGGAEDVVYDLGLQGDAQNIESIYFFEDLDSRAFSASRLM